MSTTADGFCANLSLSHPEIDRRHNIYWSRKLRKVTEFLNALSCFDSNQARLVSREGARGDGISKRHFCVNEAEESRIPHRWKVSVDVERGVISVCDLFKRGWWPRVDYQTSTCENDSTVLRHSSSLSLRRSFFDLWSCWFQTEVHHRTDWTSYFHID